MPVLSSPRKKNLRKLGSAEPSGPAPNCALCPRLAAYRAKNRTSFPTFFNEPVPSFGDSDARLLIVGLAPGLKGANRTGRPFTGDFAGELLYRALLRCGFAEGVYGAKADDGLRLIDARITNAVRCVPPGNKPASSEIATCRRFLKAEIVAMADLKAVLALGRIAHDAVLGALGAPGSAFPFRHGKRHDVAPGVKLFDSYHCSRLNTATGVLTPAMFAAVIRRIAAEIGPRPRP
jgi:uracil-DNA glycosylase family 4